jgi:integrase
MNKQVPNVSIVWQNSATKKNIQYGYLSYYPPLYDPQTGKSRRTQPTGLSIVKNPKSDLEKQINKAAQIKAEQIRKERTLELLNQSILYSEGEADQLLSDFIRENYSDSPTQKRALALLNQKFGAIRLRDITKQTAPEFLEYLKGQVSEVTGKPLSHNVITNYYRVLSWAMGKATQRGIIPPAVLSKVKPMTTKQTERKRLTAVQIDALKNDTEINPFYKRVCMFGLYTGLRISDIISLKWEHISETGGTVYVDQIEQKTGKINRIPLHLEAVKILDSIKGGNGSELVFFRPVLNGTIKAPINPNLVNQELKKHCERNGFPPYSFHTFRHTVASEILSKTGNIYAVSKILNHSNISTTQIYSHCTDEMKRSAVDMIGY